MLLQVTYWEIAKVVEICDSGIPSCSQSSWSTCRLGEMGCFRFFFPAVAHAKTLQLVVRAASSSVLFGSSCTEGGLEFLLNSGGVLNIPPDYFIMGHRKASHDAFFDHDPNAPS